MKLWHSILAVGFLIAVLFCGRAADRCLAAEADAASLSLSATVPRDRELEAKYRLAREHIGRQQFGPAVSLLQELLDQETTAFVLVGSDPLDPSGESYLDAAEAARRALFELPVEGRAVFEQRVGRLAETQLAAARAAFNLEAVKRVSTRFPLSASGLAALTYLAARAMDAGQPVLADAALRRVLEHPLLTEADRDRVQSLRRVAVREGEAPAEPRRTARQEPRPPESARPPENVANWTAAAGMSADSIEMLTEALKEQSEQSIVITPRARPIVSDGVAVVRAMSRLVAYETATGRELWNSTGMPNGFDATVQVPTNLSLKELVARSLGRQVQVDSVISDLMNDGEMLVSVDPLNAAVMLPSTLMPVDAGGSSARNVVRARRIKTGDVLWTFNGEGSLMRSAQDEVFFLGVPRRCGETLLGLAQVGTSLSAYELSAQDGTCLWSQVIAEAPRRQSVDADWRAIACPVALLDGRVVFTTSSGLIVALDLMTRQPVWASRYVREDAPPKSSQPGDQHLGRRHWWRGWRAASVEVVSAEQPREDVLLVTSPDRRALVAVSADGRQRWQRRMSDGLFVAGASGDRVVVFARHAAFAVEVASGRELWKRAIPTPSGDGFWDDDSKERFVFPHRTGFGVLDVRSGELRIDAVAGELSAGNCVRGDGGIVMQTTNGIAFVSVSRMTKSLPAKTTDDGGVAAVKQRLELLSQSPDGMRRPDELGPQRLVRQDRLIGGELLDLVEGGGRSAGTAPVKREGEAPAEPSSAAPARQEPRPPNRQEPRPPESPPMSRSELRALLDAEARRAMTSPDPFAVQRFAQRHAALPWSRETAISKAARIGQSVVQTQTLLLAQARGADRPLATAATLELAELFRSRRYDDDIRASLALLGDAELTASQVETVSKLRADFGGRPKSHWSTTKPSVTEREFARTEMAFMAVPVEAAPGSLFARLDVGFHLLSSNIVRFSGDGRPGDWTLNLQGGRAMFRYMPALVKGWGVGQLLILRLGTELFAIEPFDENGEPRARKLWSVDTRPDAQFYGHKIVPGRLGFSEPEILFLDAYDRPMGQVGPVCASYLCYQSAGKLVAIDVLTGRVLWERFELPEDSHITGDEEHVFVLDQQTREVSVLRSLDGKRLRTFDVGNAGNVISQTGRWLLRRAAGDRVELLDLRTGAVVWSRDSVDRATQFFGVDELTIGMLSASGEAHWIDLATGATRFRVQVPRPQQLEVLFCVPTPELFSLVLSGPRRPEANQFLLHPKWHRNPLVTGSVQAVDRFDGRLRWSRELTDANVMLDQPKGVPFLVLNSVQWPTNAAGAGTSSSVLTLVDQRSGEQLSRTVEPGDGMHLIRPNAAQSWATVRTRTREIRLEYAVP